MNKYTKHLIAGLVAIVLTMGIFLVSNNRQASVGGVEDGFSYKNITSSNASATVPVQVKGGFGVLGKITINTTHATTIGVYDGTTATSSGTLIASIAASTGAQTLEYDVAVTKGIVLDVPVGFAGNYTISYK